MKENINNFIVNDEDLNVDQLLDETLTLFGENSTTISMFDMLHNMRQIDDSTYAHSVNVALICRLIGKWKNFSEKDMDTLTLCGLLHDIGKSKIPNEIIGKPGKLTDSEYEEIKKHPVIGYNLVKNLDIDQRIKNAVLLHHERFDGKGYPLGLTGNEIDDFTSIVSIADVYDALVSERVYKKAYSHKKAVEMILNGECGQFNPLLLECLQDIQDRIDEEFQNVENQSEEENQERKVHDQIMETTVLGWQDFQRLCRQRKMDAM